MYQFDSIRSLAGQVYISLWMCLPVEAERDHTLEEKIRNIHGGCLVIPDVKLYIYEWEEVQSREE